MSEPMQLLSDGNPKPPDHELSVGRDPDGEPNLEVYVGKDVVSMSISRAGVISWASMIDGNTRHGVCRDPLGLALYNLCNRIAPND